MNFAQILTDNASVPASENNAHNSLRRKILVSGGLLASAALALGCTPELIVAAQTESTAQQSTTDVPVTFTPENVTYGRYYADDDGESHFGDLEMALESLELPVGPPINISAVTPAKHTYFLRIPAGYSHDWLTVGARTLWFHVAGEMEVTVSDGESRRFPAGTVVLAEDTTGKGHKARVVSEGDVLLVGVELPE
jgi:hypothetical protein